MEAVWTGRAGLGWRRPAAWLAMALAVAGPAGATAGAAPEAAGPGETGRPLAVAPAFHEETARVWRGLGEHLRGFALHLGPPWAAAEGWSPAERPLISFMLDHRHDLGLTPEQVSRLEALRHEFAREAVRREAEIRVVELELAELLGRDPLDLGLVEPKIREAARLRAELRIARLRTLEQGKAVLTPEQRARLGALLGRPARQAGGAPTRL